MRDPRTPPHVMARYLNLLAAIPRHHQVSMNTERDRIDTAQLNLFERGEIWRFGVRHGYLIALDHWEPSTAPAAKGRKVGTYRRTAKPVRAIETAPVR